MEKPKDYKEISSPIELLNYMSANINYGFLGKSGKIYNNPNSNEWKNNWYSECVVQDAEGILDTKHGTCWDQVELERNWFQENKYEYKTIFIWFEVDKSLPTHTFLIFKLNNNYYWFEHSFEKYKGIHEFFNEYELIKYVKNKQFEYAIENCGATKDDYKFIKCYEYNKPNKNIKVKDYINHVTKGKCIDENSYKS